MRIKKGILILFIVLIIIGFTLAYVLNNNFSVIRGNPFSTSKINILIIGYDSTINGPPRADTIILSSIDLNTKETGVLFIPRDTRVDIPGHGKNRINASHAFGGVELTDEILESFLDIPIDYYVETNFKGFAKIIDSLGGIEINIEEPLHYVDNAGGLYIDLPAGENKLNGEEALQYVRYREPTYGDIGRVERQRKFIKALMKKVISPDIIMKLPSLLKETVSAVNTNIPLKDVSPFVRLVKNMDLNMMKTAMVPGKPQYINGASYWIAEKEELKILIDNLIRSKEYIKNSKYKVSIFNGNGSSGIAGKLGNELEKYGFITSNIDNAGNFNYQDTIIKYYDRRDKNTAIGIRKLIGGKIQYKEEEKTEIEIIVGNDYLKRIE